MKHTTETNSIESLLGSAAHQLLQLPIIALVLIGLALVFMTLWANWTIFRRAGYPGCWSLMLLVPCVNIIFLIGFAFVRWPIEAKKSRSRG